MDIVCYSCGFAGDRKGDPLHYQLSNVKRMVHSVLDKTGATHHYGYLTGAGNYREKIATIKKYKGNRDSSHKPVHYDEIRQYLIDVFGAEIVIGREADDAMGCKQYADQENCVICTIDKDLNMIPGWHYNWTKETMTWIDLDQADAFFYKQLLTGDPTDNIAGCPGIGEKRAEKILHGLTDNKARFDNVLSNYASVYKDAELGMKMLRENADLLWIQRKENKLWEPPNAKET